MNGMASSHVCILRSVAVVAATVASQAWADDRLAFDVVGAVTPSCALASARLGIDLGAVTFAELGSVGAGSAWRGGSFVGVDCVGATRASVTVRARPYAPDPRYLASSGGADGVAIQLRTGAGEAVLPDGSVPVAFAWGEGEARLAFEARYVRVGPLRAGEASASAVIEITWE
ncbi:MAG: fimbrial protein [Luteibacter sp.]